MKVLTIGEKEVSLEELLTIVKNNGRDTVLKPLIQQAIIEKHAAGNNIVASVEELQERFDVLRRRRGLYTAAETERWMAANSFSLEDLEREAEISVLMEKIRESFPLAAVEKFFAENKANMDGADLSIITVKEQEVGKELLALLREGEGDFMALACEYSIDPRAKSGGYVGVVQRPALQDDLAAEVFGAQPGDVVGPFEVDGGYNLVRVNALYPVVLDVQKEKEIRTLLFQEFLAEQEKSMKVKWEV